MHIQCVFGHIKPVVLACCVRVITFVPEIIYIPSFQASLGQTIFEKGLLVSVASVLQNPGKPEYFRLPFCDRISCVFNCEDLCILFQEL